MGVSRRSTAVWRVRLKHELESGGRRKELTSGARGSKKEKGKEEVGGRLARVERRSSGLGRGGEKMGLARVEKN